MSARFSFRLAAAILFLFAAGHTFGFLSFRPPSDEGRKIWQAMQDVHFEVQGARFSYGGFYMGFGLSITLSILFTAFLCWWMSGMAAREPNAIAKLGWALCVLQLGSLILSAIYFAIEPAIFSGFLTLLLGWAAFRSGRPARA